MAQYYTDFSGYSTGSPPSDWTLRWGSQSSDWTVQQDGDATEGPNVLHVVPAEPRTLAISWDEPGTPSDVEIVAKFVADSGDATLVQPRVTTRSGGSATSRDAYFAEDLVDSDTHRIGKYVNDSSTLIAEGSNTPNSNEYWWIRLRVNSGDLYFKSWQDGSGEPQSWDISGSDTDLNSGWVGLMTVSNQDVSTYWIKYDAVGIGTGGDEAPTSTVISTPTAPTNAALTSP